MDKKRVVRCAQPTPQELGAITSYEELCIERDYMDQEEREDWEEQQKELEGEAMRNRWFVSFRHGKSRCPYYAIGFSCGYPQRLALFIGVAVYKYYVELEIGHEQ